MLVARSRGTSSRFISRSFPSSLSALVIRLFVNVSSAPRLYETVLSATVVTGTRPDTQRIPDTKPKCRLFIAADVRLPPRAEVSPRRYFSVRYFVRRINSIRARANQLARLSQNGRVIYRSRRQRDVLLRTRARVKTSARPSRHRLRSIYSQHPASREIRAASRQCVRPFSGATL